MLRHPLVMVFGLALVAMATALGLPAWLGGERADAPVSESARIASLTPALSATLVALGAAESVVAVSDFCAREGISAQLPRAGTALQPNLEALVRVQPDLILATEAQSLPVEALGHVAPTTSLPWSSATEVVSSLKQLGTLVGKPEAAEALARRFEGELLKEPPAGAPRVLLLLGFGALSEGELWFIKPGSLHDQVLRAAGGQNALSEEVEGAPSIPLERLLTLDPDLIIVLSPKGGMSAADKALLLEPLTRLEPLRASKMGRLGVLDREDVLGEGPGLLDLVRPMREMIAELHTQRGGR